MDIPDEWTIVAWTSLFFVMAEVTILNDVQQNPVSGVHETQLLMVTDNLPTNSGDVEEPPTKKCKHISSDKSRLLEDRIGSILSCCICLDLSTLAMFQVRIFLLKTKGQSCFLSVYQWTSYVCFMF